MGEESNRTKNPSRKKVDWFFWTAVCFLILTAFFRIYHLSDAPAGLTDDELTNIEISHWLRDGYVSIIYDESEPGREISYYSILAVFSSIFGDGGTILWRLPSVWISIITLALTAKLMRSLFNSRISLLGLGLMAVLFWPVWLGRSVLHVTLVPFITSLTAYTVMRAIRSPDNGTAALWYTFAGISLGLSQYIHVICWTTLFVFLLYILYVFIADRELFNKHWVNILYMLALSLVILIPLFIYLSSNAGVRDRVPLSQQPGLISEIPSRLIAAIAGLGIRGDMQAIHNIPGRPVFGPFLAVLFLVGIGISAARWRQREYMTILIWLGVGLLPTIFLPHRSDFEYMAGILPIIFVFPSLALYEGFLLAKDTFLAKLKKTQLDMLFGSLAALIILLNAGWTYRDFFFNWAERDDVQLAYNSEIGEIALYLDTSKEDTPISICSSLSKDEEVGFSFSNKDLLDILRHRADHSIRYFNCNRSLLLLNGGEEQRVIFPRRHYYNLPGALLSWFNYAEDIGIDGVDENVAMRLVADEPLANYLGGLVTKSPTAWPPEIGDYRLAKLPVRFGYNVAFLGYEIRNSELRPGDYVEATTFWRMDGPSPSDLSQFTHVLGSPYLVLAQNDGMGTSIGTLESRDVFIEYNLIELPENITEGFYSLSTGMYFPDTAERLPAFEGGDFIADRLYIQQIHIIE